MMLHSRDAVTVSAAVATRSRAECTSMEGHTSLSTALVIQFVRIDPCASTSSRARIHWRPAMIGQEFLYLIYKTLKKCRFCTKWRHVACSMDIIVSKNLSEAGNTSSLLITRTHATSFLKIPDVPRRLAFSNFEHLVSVSSEHRNTQTDRQLKKTAWIAL